METEEEGEQAKVIPSKHAEKKDKKIMKIATWDIETVTPFTIPSVYMSGIAWDNDFVSFEGTHDNLKRMWDYVV